MMAAKEPPPKRRVLVTGGCGFIGSHFVQCLLERYPSYHIVVLDSMEYCASPQVPKLHADRKGFHFVKGTIRSVELVVQLLRQHAIDTVVHFAASTDVDRSFERPLDFTETNVLGTHALLEASRQVRHQLQTWIHMSTDEVYGDGPMESTNTPRLFAPTNPYAASKAAAESLVQSYASAFHLPIMIVRSNNVYGPGQYPEKIIPNFITRLLRHEKCCIQGNGSNRRRYLYVKDAVAAMDLILHRGVVGREYNIGSDFDCSNLEVAQQLIACMRLDSISKWVEFVPDRVYNDVGYAMDTRRVREELGWSETVEFSQGLRRTIEWYREHPIEQWWPELEMDAGTSLKRK